LSEDRYFKALYELDKAEMKLEYTIGLESKILRILAIVNTEHKKPIVEQST
jgi:hypothetical protein